MRRVIATVVTARRSRIRISLKRSGSLALAVLLLNGFAEQFTQKALAGPRPTGSVVVLVYHRISEPNGRADEEWTPLDRFTAQMEWLHAAGYQTLSLEELRRGLLGEVPLPLRAVALHFDDGWTNVTAALPVLRRLRLKASFLIISDAADGRFGTDYLGWDAIRQLDQDPQFDVGSHTLTHPWDPNNNLLLWSRHTNRRSEVAKINRELLDSRIRLEQELEHPVTSLAWPCGWYNRSLSHAALGHGYKLLLTYDCGVNRPGLGAINAVQRCGIEGGYDMSTFQQLVQQ